jgi:hypothetical protein
MYVHIFKNWSTKKLFILAELGQMFTPTISTKAIQPTLDYGADGNHG